MIECEYNINNEYCKIASMLMGTEDKVPIQEKACEVCQNLENPKTVNKVTLGTAIATLMQLGKFETTTHQHLMDTLNGEMGKIPDKGPGTNLKRYLSWFATEQVGCDCQNKEKIMNAWGPIQCEKNIDTILTWLEDSAKQRNLPFIKFIVKMIVTKAINEAKR